MRDSFEAQLQQVVTGTLTMLAKVRVMLTQAQDVLVDRQTDLLSVVTAADREIDQLETQIEEQCLRLIALQSPVARDLRLVGTFMKNLSDIERMGDYAVHVAEDGALLAQEPPLKKYVNLAQMISRLDQMLELIQKAIQNRDISISQQVLEMDNEVDELYEQTQRELVTYMIEDPRTITKAMTLMRVGRSLERFGDHIENIAERLEFWVTGQRHESSNHA